MRKYKIPVTWEMSGLVEVRADSIEEAMAMVKRDEDKDGNEFGLPTVCDYVEGSFAVSDGYTAEEILSLFNPGMQEEVKHES